MSPDSRPAARRLRIAFVSGIESSGGAARAAIRLHDALARRPDVELRHFTGRADRPGSGAVAFTQPGRLGALAASLAEAAGVRLARTRAHRDNLLRAVRDYRPDVISLHNLNPWTGLGFTRDIVCALAAIAPVAWRMPDMWPVSGCCSYTDFCERGGQACVWNARATRDACGAAARAENQALSALGRRLLLISPSRWLAGVAREVFGASPAAETILSGLDLSFWKPLDRRAARLALDLPPDGPLVFAAADRLSLRLKGMPELIAAAARLPGIRLVTAGRLRPEDRAAWPAGTLHLAEVQDDRVLRLAYSAADVTAIPSLAENLPGVGVESLACGTPLAAFAVGGLPDLIMPGETGWLAPSRDADGLATALRDACADPDPSGRRARCRAFAEHHLDADTQAGRQLDLLRSLVSP